MKELSGALHERACAPRHHGHVVEPGGFRTDFAGRSLSQSAEAHRRLRRHRRPAPQGDRDGHGTQPGDPAKAGAAIITAVESSEPPAFLLLGPDALGAYRYIADARANEIAKWEELTASTDFDS